MILEGAQSVGSGLQNNEEGLCFHELIRNAGESYFVSSMICVLMTVVDKE